MFTNTYYPSVGGIEKSIQDSAAQMRRQGHEVLIVAPAYNGATESSDTVLRVPAIKQIGHTPHSIALRLPTRIERQVLAFAPDIVHSHQPFLLGDSAVRIARALGVPVLYTHHTFMERYLHWFAVDWRVLRNIAEKLPVAYAQLVDHVVTPTESVAHIMRERGMTTPITAIPTGIDADFYAGGDRAAFRASLGIDPDCFILGHLGRLNPEKNLDFLAEVVLAFVALNPLKYKILLVGEGESVPTFKKRFTEHGLADHLIYTGSKLGQASADAYAAMDAFIFTSLTDTQGLVLSEAMAAGNPVFALDAPGARDMISHGRNGYVVPRDTAPDQFAQTIHEVVGNIERFTAMQTAAAEDARQVSLPSCCEAMLALYAELIAARPAISAPPSGLAGLSRRWRTEARLARQKLACLW